VVAGAVGCVGVGVGVGVAGGVEGAGGVVEWVGRGVGVLAGGFGFEGFLVGFAVLFAGCVALAGVERSEGASVCAGDDGEAEGDGLVLFFGFAFGAGPRWPLSASTSPCGGCPDALGTIEVTWILDEADERSAPEPSEPDCWSAHAVPPNAAAEATAAADSLSHRERPRRCFAWLRMCDEDPFS
jgi:hypothetical protein